MIHFPRQWGKDFKETVVGHYFKSFQRNVDPTATLKFEAPRDQTPACTWLTKGEIRNNPSMVAMSPKILLLHELIHHKLSLRDGDPDEAEAGRFQAEVKRLFDAGAIYP